MKKFYFLCAFALVSLFVASCSNDDSIISGVPTPETKTRSLDTRLVDYLTVEDGQWILNISKYDASTIGKSEEYDKLVNQIGPINARIRELHNNPYATIGFNLPTHERIIMKAGKTLSRVKTSPFIANIEATRAGTFITSMTANQSTFFGTEWNESKISSNAYIQSAFVWSFELRDEVWTANIWNESGVGTGNIDHSWIYSLSDPNRKNAWKFSSTGTQTEGTNITFSFYK